MPSSPRAQGRATSPHAAPVHRVDHGTNPSHPLTSVLLVSAAGLLMLQMPWFSSWAWPEVCVDKQSTGII